MRATFQAIAQLLPDPLLLVARDAQVVGANEAAARHFGVSPGQLEGQPLSDLILVDDEVNGYLARCLRSTSPHAGVLVDRRRGERVHCDGTRFPEHESGLVVLRLSIERGSQFGLLTQKIDALNREVLQRREAEARSERLIEELARAVRLSELLMAVVGHDLRNPIGAVMAGTALALRRVDDPQVRAQLERVNRSARRMERMVAQLLDVSRVRLGRGLQLERVPTDLGELVRQAVVETEFGFPDHRFDLRMEGASAGEWDRDRLEQVLSNLLANACQHSEPGSTVTVRLSDAEGCVRVAVHNVGAPIPEDVLPNLFDAFTGSTSSGGLGLGLYIARVIVRAHGGEIEVESSAPAGTTFTLTLPRAAPVPADADVGEVPGLVGDGSSQRARATP
jgi:PAS domain S-box-containing protein